MEGYRGPGEINFYERLWVKDMRYDINGGAYGNRLVSTGNEKWESWKEMKKIKYILLSCTLLSSIFAIPAANATADGTQSIIVLVNYQKVDFPSSVNPYIVSGTTMVPVRGVFEKMNADVTWKRNSQGKIEVTAKHFEDIAVMTVGSKTASRNGVPIQLNSPAENINGRVSVPLRFISEAFGGDVSWIPKSESRNSFDYIRVDGQFLYPNKQMDLEMTYHQSGAGDPVQITSFPVVIKHKDKIITIKNITNSYHLWNSPNDKKLLAKNIINGDPNFEWYSKTDTGIVRIQYQVEALTDNVLVDEMIFGKENFTLQSNYSGTQMASKGPWQISQGPLNPEQFEGFMKSTLLKAGEKTEGILPLEYFSPNSQQDLMIIIDPHDTFGISLKIPTTKN